MTDQRSENLPAHVMTAIRDAFASRSIPTVMTTSVQLSGLEYEEVMAFSGKSWDVVTFDMVERYADAVFWFAPKAFCYYLPGFLAAGLQAGRRDSNAYDALIGMLDRSAEPDNWDEFFVERWPLLSADELDAVALWMQWFEESDVYFPNTFERVLETLSLLKQKQAGP
jgi:hypothetical protein